MLLEIGIHPDNIRHAHVGRLCNGGDVIQRLLHFAGKIRRELSRQRIGASLRRHVENVIGLDSGRIDVCSLRPSRRMDHLSMDGTAHGDTVDLDVLPVGKSPYHQDSPRRRMITNRLPIDIVHGSDILRVGHIDVDPDGVAEIHSCRPQHVLHMAQRLARLLLKILWEDCRRYSVRPDRRRRASGWRERRHSTPGQHLLPSILMSLTAPPVCASSWAPHAASKKAQSKRWAAF